VPGGDYAAVVEKIRPELAAPGDIVDAAGQVLGRHNGIHRFTVGQRRGLELGGQAEPLYVVGIDASRNRVIAGPRRALAVSAVRLEGANLLGPVEGLLMVKVRSMAPRFAEPQYGVAPGQAAVAYVGDRLVAGGTMVETIAADPLLIPA
jgi:tRNA-uridine 2-sulfurtransferase